MGLGMAPNEAGGMIGKTGVRSPLRSQFLNAVGTPPDSRISSFGGLPTSSPGGFNTARPSWLQQQSLSGGMMAPPPAKVGTGVGGGLGAGGVGAVQKPAHDADDDLFALDDLLEG
jgi:hypothetical protein